MSKEEERIESFFKKYPVSYILKVKPYVFDGVSTGYSSQCPFCCEGAYN